MTAALILGPLLLALAVVVGARRYIERIRSAPPAAERVVEQIVARREHRVRRASPTPQHGIRVVEAMRPGYPQRFLYPLDKPSAPERVPDATGVHRAVRR